ncbi:unnamed protein product [Cyclocybe aegerita]|uniref:Uncharacterized protein n=1 Tax=Cyclocybe aegerita TaxID=1973307 RepID=A0A8S0VXY0_CYCAE|nr:unnamed protein product [Cyclocybe aegerita]
MPPFSGSSQRPSFRPKPTWWQKKPKEEKLPGDRNIMEGIAVPIIDIPEDNPKAQSVEITNCTYIGSYNWLERETPTILVPGSPPQWLDKPMPYHVPVDKGVICCDRNGLNMPNTILLPLVVAVNKTAECKNSPPFDWTSVDFVLDRNALRKLMRWSNGTAHDFRFDLQLAGKKTVLVNRFPLKVLEEASGFSSRYNFEKQSMQSLPDCSEHYRIVTLEMNGWQMVVRSEVDAFVPNEGNALAPGVRSSDLDTQLRAMSLSSSNQEPNILKVQQGGRDIPASTLVELTTRSALSSTERNVLNWRDRYSQLLFSETASHFLALHERGNYQRLEKRSITAPEFKNAEEDAQKDIQKLVKVLELIRNLVIEEGKEGRLSVVCMDKVLSIHKRQGRESCLPDSMMALFESA